MHHVSITKEETQEHIWYLTQWLNISIQNVISPDWVQENLCLFHRCVLNFWWNPIIYHIQVYNRCVVLLLTGAQIQSLCLQVVLHQGASSPSASLFLTSWLLPPLWDSLKVLLTLPTNRHPSGSSLPCADSTSPGTVMTSAIER